MPKPEFPLWKVGDVAQKVINDEPQGYVPTGIKGMDTLITGCFQGELVLIAGPPSSGKTSVAMQVLESAALSGVASGIVSMEMPEKSLVQRILAARSGVPMDVIRTRKWTAKDQPELVKMAAADLGAMDLTIVAQGSLSADRISDAIGVLVENGAGIVAVDYLQLASGAGESRNADVGAVARVVKTAAVRHNVPVLGLSQINRAATQRERREPRMSDLRDSGELEQVADTVIMLYYPNDPEDRGADVREAEAHIVKQRNGPLGKVTGWFDGKRTRFTEERP